MSKRNKPSFMKNCILQIFMNGGLFMKMVFGNSMYSFLKRLRMIIGEKNQLKKVDERNLTVIIMRIEKNH